MKLGPGGAVGFEKGLVFNQASKATLRSQRLVALVPGLDPCVEGRDIEETLLASQGHELISLDPECRSPPI
jgi:hypothetical protein